MGLEPGSVVAELGGFPLREAKFRRDMEKLRNSQQKDLSLHKVIIYDSILFRLVNVFILIEWTEINLILFSFRWNVTELSCYNKRFRN